MAAKLLQEAQVVTTLSHDECDWGLLTNASTRTCARADLFWATGLMLSK
jgi:hypothetical protein